MLFLFCCFKALPPYHPFMRVTQPESARTCTPNTNSNSGRRIQHPADAPAKGRACTSALDLFHHGLLITFRTGDFSKVRVRPTPHHVHQADLARQHKSRNDDVPSCRSWVGPSRGSFLGKGNVLIYWQSQLSPLGNIQGKSRRPVRLRACSAARCRATWTWRDCPSRSRRGERDPTAPADV